MLHITKQSQEKNSIKVKAKLKLREGTFGSYKKGDTAWFYFDMLDEQNGLSRYPIEKKWEILEMYIGKEEEINKI